MPWTKDDYPASMKNLAEPVLDKAIEIGNTLVEKGYEKQQAIAIAIFQAKEWYNNRGETVGTEITHHLVPDGDRWLIRGEQSGAKLAFDTKKEALEALEKLSQKREMKTMIHDSEGKFQSVF